MSREDIVTKDRSGKLWFVHLTTGCDGDINVSIKERPRQRYGEYMKFWDFIKFAKKKRLRGLGYAELFGPNAEKYGKQQLWGIQ